MVLLTGFKLSVAGLPWSEEVQSFRKLVVEDQVEGTLSLLDGRVEVHLTGPVTDHTKNTRSSFNSRRNIETTIKKTTHDCS